MRILFSLVLALSAALSLEARSGAMEFDLPSPNTEPPNKTKLWATQYHIWHAQETDAGAPLLNQSNKKLTGNIPLRDWCMAAIEGTVLVTAKAGNTRTYNYVDHKGINQVDCAKILNINPLKKPWISAIGKSRYTVANGQFGDGVLNYRLIPFRTIAVDQSKIPYGSVVYIPQAKGVAFTLPSGSTATHDGYFFAADTGGAIKGNHIDVFSGISTTNPFPGFIHSKDTSTFDAYIIEQPAIKEQLESVHR